MDIGHGDICCTQKPNEWDSRSGLCVHWWIASADSAVSASRHSAGSCANKAPCKAHGHSRHRFTSLYIIYTHELLTHYTRLKTQLASPPLHIIHRSMPACACALSSAVIVRTHAEARALSSWRHGRAAWRPPSAGASVRACARPTAPAPARRPSPQRRGRRRRARRVWPLRR